MTLIYFALNVQIVLVDLYLKVEHSTQVVNEWITISKIIPTKEAREKELKAERKKQYDKLKQEFEKLKQEIERDDKE
jgi:hypothetical protein